MNLHAVKRKIKHPDVPVLDRTTYRRLIDLERIDDDDEYVAVSGYVTDMWIEDNLSLALFTLHGNESYIIMTDYSATEIEDQNRAYPNGFRWSWELVDDYVYTGPPR